MVLEPSETVISTTSLDQTSEVKETETQSTTFDLSESLLQTPLSPPAEETVDSKRFVAQNV